MGVSLEVIEKVKRILENKAAQNNERAKSELEKIKKSVEKAKRFRARQNSMISGTISDLGFLSKTSNTSNKLGSILNEQLQKRLSEKPYQFENELEKSKFEDTLVNNKVISKFIESAFNGNILILPPIDREKE